MIIKVQINVEELSKTGLELGDDVQTIPIYFRGQSETIKLEKGKWYRVETGKILQ